MVSRSPILNEHNASFHVVFGELKRRLHQRASRKKEKDPGESLSNKALAKEQQPDTVAQKHVEWGGSVAFTDRVLTSASPHNYIAVSYNHF